MKNCLRLGLTAALAVMGAGVADAGDRNMTITTRGDRPLESCNQVEITSDNGTVVRADEEFTLAGTATLRGRTAPNGGFYVQAWDRAEVSVRLCKAAVAGSRRAAEDLLRRISLTREPGRLEVSGPGDDWVAYLIVFVPRAMALDFRTTNGPIDLTGTSGRVTASTENGPIALRDCSGDITARTENGPVSYRGTGGGRVELRTQNGPVSVKLTTGRWSGGSLEASTQNGPLQFTAPEDFRPGAQVISTGYGPWNCKGKPCSGTWTGRERRMQLGGDPAVTLSTVNGPVSVSLQPGIM
ncbi:MAG TPA: hypothetical protein VGA40_07655 [Candidatus Acidoferrales bacterium]